MLRYHPSMKKVKVELKPKTQAIAPMPGRARSEIRPLPITPLPKMAPAHAKMSIKPLTSSRVSMTIKPKYGNPALPWLGQRIAPGWTSENVSNLQTAKSGFPSQVPRVPDDVRGSADLTQQFAARFHPGNVGGERERPEEHRTMRCGRPVQARHDVAQLFFSHSGTVV